MVQLLNEYHKHTDIDFQSGAQGIWASIALSPLSACTQELFTGYIWEESGP